MVVDGLANLSGWNFGRRRAVPVGSSRQGWVSITNAAILMQINSDRDFCGKIGTHDIVISAFQQNPTRKDWVMKFFNLRVMVISLAFALVGLSGVVVAGDEGCVSCHAGPMALNELLAARFEGHPDVGMMVNTVPTDCAMCHAKDSDVSLMGIIHPAHDGMDCQSCHTVDENNMPTGVKTGAKNW
jgi:hypothetical protein